MRQFFRTPPGDLRRTISAILRRHRNGATWRAIPEALGPWWRAAQIFRRWTVSGARERLFDMAREAGVALGGVASRFHRHGRWNGNGGMTFLDGSNIRAHAKAAGALERGLTAWNEIVVKHLAVLVEAMAPRLA